MYLNDALRLEGKAGQGELKGTDGVTYWQVGLRPGPGSMREVGVVVSQAMKNSTRVLLSSWSFPSSGGRGDN